MCPYCAQTNTRKDEHGYCIVYGCYNRKKSDIRQQEINLFNSHPVAKTVEKVTTTKTYNFGKLVDTTVTYN